MTKQDDYGKVAITVHVQHALEKETAPMPTGKEDLLQALVEAFIMEKGTREFYRQAVSRSAAPQAQKTFQDLAAWEEKHMAYIQSLYQSILDDRELEEFAEFSKKVAAPVTESGIPVKDLEKRIERYQVKDQHDALTLALSIEAKAHKMYKDLASRATDNEAKVIFEDMVAQETKHMEQLHALRKTLPAK
jgi:rubrerythrin